MATIFAKQSETFGIEIVRPAYQPLVSPPLNNFKHYLNPSADDDWIQVSCSTRNRWRTSPQRLPKKTCQKAPEHSTQYSILYSHPGHTSDSSESSCQPVSKQIQGLGPFKSCDEFELPFSDFEEDGYESLTDDEYRLFSSVEVLTRPASIDSVISRKVSLQEDMCTDTPALSSVIDQLENDRSVARTLSQPVSACGKVQISRTLSQPAPELSPPWHEAFVAQCTNCQGSMGPARRACRGVCYVKKCRCEHFLQSLDTGDGDQSADEENQG
mmetsp:Transcript_35236/g.58003  ORF Transcript_35236/g.58003 Transcript_35236/m.58003 type:complete len:270 (+) Transcript_35236:83-892(+)